ncbi:MAG: hypothetical protein NTX50_23420 [Candidatus Sumerlaeota bacterium]|nr:hypothetical protein [Candidatus Sumerlaeota bacterium]
MTPTSAQDIQAGVAVADITPPVPYRMSGYFSERLSTGVDNPLQAKAIVIRQGSKRIAMVFCDLIGLPREVSSEARKQASAKTGIPVTHILLAATHTHTGPLYNDALRQHFHELAVSKLGRDPYETVDYPTQLISKIVHAIALADAATTSARLAAGTTEQQGLSFNRRFHMKDGSVRFNPGPLNPDIVRAAGPIDPQAGIVLVRGAADGAAKAALVNFALHLDTTGGTMYSADYPFYVERSLRETLGADFMLLYGTGTCGDINHIDITRKQRPKADEIGTSLAQTLKAALPGLAPVSAPALAMRSEAVRVPLQRFPDEKLAWAKENIHKVGSRDLSFLEQVEAYKILSVKQLGGDSIPLEVQVIKLSGDVAIVGLPGEVFVDFGLAIKRASPFATTLVIELCEDCPGYIPTQKAFAEGSYETVNSRIAPGGGEMMTDLAIRLLKELHSEPGG